MNELINFIDEYLKARNEAMLAYPNTRLLDELVENYQGFFSLQFHMMWDHATHYTKVRTLEIMIKDWNKAPDWLIAKVKEAEESRI